MRTNSRARATASVSAQPWARNRAIALASVQPVPWVLVVSIRVPCQLVMLSVSISASASASPSSCPPLISTAQPCSPTRWSAAATGSSSSVSAFNSGRLGVAIVATFISSPKAATVAASARTDPLVATITGSNTIGRSGRSAFIASSRAASWVGGKGAADHADLDRIDADVADDRVDLGEHHFRRHRVDGARRRACSGRSPR